ncbi:MAG: Gfo/Idh/MocA family oxidoreductase [Planctomycetota bacterium]
MIRVGIAGVGFMGMVHYLCYRDLPGVEVVAIADRHPERLAGDWTAIRGNFGPPGEQMDLAGVASYASPEEMIADTSVDLIDICLPPAQHMRVTTAALAAGKHVFCEKPMALSLGDCDRMLAAADAANRQLLIGHVLPYFPEYAWALREVRGGGHGRVLGASFKRVVADPEWVAQFWEADVVGGPMLDLHVHDAHFIRLTLGDPTEVTTRGLMRGDLPEHWHTLMEFGASRERLTVEATSGVLRQQGRQFVHGFEIRFERTTLAFEFLVQGESAGYTCPPTVYCDAGEATTVDLGNADPMQAFHAELSDVAASIESGRPADALSGVLARDAIGLCERQSECLRRSIARSEAPS